MKNLILAILLCAYLSGCASFHTIQTDEIDKSGTRKVTTEIRTRTFWDSKSELAKLTATTTDKSQRIGVGSIAQESSATNAVVLIESVVGAAVKAALGK